MLNVEKSTSNNMARCHVAIEPNEINSVFPINHRSTIRGDKDYYVYYVDSRYYVDVLATEPPHRIAMVLVLETHDLS